MNKLISLKKKLLLTGEIALVSSHSQIYRSYFDTQQHTPYSLAPRPHTYRWRENNGRTPLWIIYIYLWPNAFKLQWVFYL